MTQPIDVPSDEYFGDAANDDAAPSSGPRDEPDQVALARAALDAATLAAAKSREADMAEPVAPTNPTVDVEHAQAPELVDATMLESGATASGAAPLPEPTGTVASIATATKKTARQTKASALNALIRSLPGLVNANGMLAVLVERNVVRARTPAFHALVRQRLSDPNAAAVTINAASDAVDLAGLTSYVPPERRRLPGEGWRDELQYRQTREGPALKSSALNVSIFLLNHPDWIGVVALDLFAERIVTRRLPPWPEELRPASAKPGTWQDSDDALLQAWFSHAECADFGSDAIRAGLSIAAGKAEFHPVREWLDSLVWDGVKRIDTVLPVYFNTADTLYEQRVGAAVLRQAVARIYEPGCQADYALILEGDQGFRKSSALAALVPRPEWYADSGVDVTNKDSYENLRGKWFYCLSELASMARGDVERWKTYITSRQDSYRQSYAARSRDFPRQTVFVGDTNKERYLNDVTGGRRWWPTKVRRPIDVSKIERDREQLWAEAVATYKAGESRWLDSAGAELLAKEQQAERQVDDPWTTLVAEWIAHPTRESWDEGGDGQMHRCLVRHDISTGLLVADVLAHALKLKPEAMKGEPSNRVGAILTRLGWTSRRCEVRTVRAVRWFPSTAPPEGLPDIDDADRAGGEGGT